MWYNLIKQMFIYIQVIIGPCHIQVFMPYMCFKYQDIIIINDQ
jgi:hypothetical protein